MQTLTLDDVIARLNTGEKLALIEKLWSSIDTDALTVEPTVAAELERRWAEHLRDPSAALTLDELMARVERKVR